MDRPVEIVGPDGKTMVKAIRLAFTPVTEPWCHYNLTDGGIIRFRGTVNEVFWLCDDEGVPIRVNGYPNIWTHSDNQISVNM